MIEEEWIDYARVDLCIAGGITEAKKIAGWCETHYIKLAVHNPLGPVSSAAFPTDAEQARTRSQNGLYV